MAELELKLTKKTKGGKVTGRMPTTNEAILLFFTALIVIIMGIRINIGIAAALMCGTLLAALFSTYLGYSWTEIQSAMVSGIVNSLPAIIILMLVGMIIGIWIAGGTVPTLIYYGLQILSPRWFLPITFILCAIVSTATGTSFGTIGTMGLALIGVGEGLGLPLAAVAGCIVSGSYFGDKMSPLSDTTNIAPAMAGAELFDHIRSMMYTTIPATVIALICYTIIGYNYQGNDISSPQVQQLLTAIPANFNISLWTLLPPVVVITLSIMKFPSIPVLATSVVVSAVMAIFTQGLSFVAVVNAAMNGNVSNVGVELIDKVFTGGGMGKMLGTIAVIMIATSFGGILESSGVLSTVVTALLKKVKRTGDLIVCVILSCYLVAVSAGSGTLSIILPGRTFKSAFEERNIAANVLSRTLEDAATLGITLVPWSVPGLYITGMLHVPTIQYAPYNILCWITPIFSIIFGYTGFAIWNRNQETKVDG